MGKGHGATAGAGIAAMLLGLFARVGDDCGRAGLKAARVGADDAVRLGARPASHLDDVGRFGRLPMGALDDVGRSGVRGVAHAEVPLDVRIREQVIDTAIEEGSTNALEIMLEAGDETGPSPAVKPPQQRYVPKPMLSSFLPAAAANAADYFGRAPTATEATNLDRAVQLDGAYVTRPVFDAFPIEKLLSWRGLMITSGTAKASAPDRIERWEGPPIAVAQVQRRCLTGGRRCAILVCVGTRWEAATPCPVRLPHVVAQAAEPRPKSHAHLLRNLIDARRALGLDNLVIHGVTGPLRKPRLVHSLPPALAPAASAASATTSRSRDAESPPRPPR